MNPQKRSTPAAMLAADAGRAKLNVVAVSGGKFVATNQPLPGSRLPETAAIKHGRSSEAARLTAEELAEKIQNADSSWAERRVGEPVLSWHGEAIAQNPAPQGRNWF